MIVDEECRTRFYLKCTDLVRVQESTKTPCKCVDVEKHYEHHQYQGNNQVQTGWANKIILPALITFSVSSYHTETPLAFSAQDASWFPVAHTQFLGVKDVFILCSYRFLSPRTITIAFWTSISNKVSVHHPSPEATIEKDGLSVFVASRDSLRLFFTHTAPLA